MKKKITLLPKTERILQQLGENIRLARLRRKISVELLSERAGISRATLWSIEKGSPSVSMGAYIQVLAVLGLSSDMLKVAEDDELGRRLQDAGLKTRIRAPKRGS